MSYESKWKNAKGCNNFSKVTIVTVVAISEINSSERKRINVQSTTLALSNTMRVPKRAHLVIRGSYAAPEDKCLASTPKIRTSARG
ncbi:hypothetical protein EVAR_36956_1 [Eumeta japonica]|uniref:Uncharacterized protein n=1 Tax=Eumeta variegata TaxID=151549 RepID=A0A4C1W7Z8_EUMVA|nr:hypothetical protein EVAR_36956_1 [Eumeta japonica]